jgi:hypothetical protein
MATLKLKPSALMRSLISTVLTAGVLLVSSASTGITHAQASTSNQNSSVESQLRSAVNPQVCYKILGVGTICY